MVANLPGGIHMKVERFEGNPIIQPSDIAPSRDDFEVVGVFNAAAIRFEGKILLLLRVAERPVNFHPDIELVPYFDPGEGRVIVKDFNKCDPAVDFSDPRFINSGGRKYLTSISHLRLARSIDGVEFNIDPEPFMQAAGPLESFGIEDPRATFIDGVYYITYVAVSPAGVVTMLASTADFRGVDRLGVIFCPENKNVVIFPARIGGRYFALHRPESGLFSRRQIWIAESPDLTCWGSHRLLMETRGGWEEARIGAGAVPLAVSGGWLEVYHGADKSGRYCMGAVLLDGEKPWRVLARCKAPLLAPEAPYESKGFFSDTVFTCGAIEGDGLLSIYYGAADRSLCCARATVKDILAWMEPEACE
jgi:predicted GH43/DUF377 family glycosyl hydrolase